MNTSMTLTAATEAAIRRAPADLRKPLADAAAASLADFGDPETLPADFREIVERGAVMDFLLQLGDESPPTP